MLNRFYAIAVFAGFLVVRPGPSLVSTAAAEYIQPSQVVVKTKIYTPLPTHFASGTYQYNVSYGGIPVGKASVSVRRGRFESSPSNFEPTMTVTALASSASVVKWFYSLKHLSESTFRSDNFTPISFYSVQTENSKSKSRTVVFRGNGNIRSSLWKAGNTSPEEEISFQTDNQTFDPISAAFLARSLPVNDNEELSFDVFNGKHRFLITFKVLGKETIEVNDVLREAYKVVPSVKKLTDTEGEKRLREATIWIAADASRDVLMLRSEVVVGSITAEMSGFTPDPLPLPDSTVRASMGISGAAESPKPIDPPAAAAK